MSGVLQTLISRAWKLYTPANFHGTGEPETSWIATIKEMTKPSGQHVVRVVVDIPLSMAEPYVVANMRAASEALIDAQDALDLLSLDKYPAPETEDDNDNPDCD